MGEKAQLREKNAPRASMVHFVKYVLLVLAPPHCTLHLGIHVGMPLFAPYRDSCHAFLDVHACFHPIRVAFLHVF